MEKKRPRRRIVVVPGDSFHGIGEDDAAERTGTASSHEDGGGHGGGEGGGDYGLERCHGSEIESEGIRMRVRERGVRPGLILSRGTVPVARRSSSGHGVHA